MMKGQRKSLTIVLTLTLAAFVLMGCGDKEGQVSQQKEPEQESVEATYTLFFPYDTGTDVAIREVAVTAELEENESKLDQLAELLRSPEGQGNPVFGPDATFLDVTELEDEIIKVNVNRAFISQMNAGTGLEEKIIQSLVNSICELYEAKGVLLRVEGQPYESGHFAYRENEVIYAQ